MFVNPNWTDYQLLDGKSGEKLERWGKFTYLRPEPQIVWDEPLNAALWKKIDAKYTRSSRGGGSWQFYRPEAEQRFVIGYRDLKFYIRPMGFKHMGLFPEQSTNWDYVSSKIKESGRELRVLNLFGYTGGATVAALAAGASVCHVDAARGMVTYARENIELNGLQDRKIRYIVDDAVKFLEREIRRGNRYDIVIMDPPSYGKGPKGVVFKIEQELYHLLDSAAKVMSDSPVCFLINSYTTGLSPLAVENVVRLTFCKKFGGQISGGELALPIQDTGLYLPCGSTVRWES